MGAAQTGTTTTQTIEEDHAPALSANVLLVEDNSVNQEICAEMLVGMGCDVEVVSDGRAGVEAAFSRPYDIVLMDCQMPVMDGFEAAAAIRAREADPASAPRRRLPVIALTANAMSGDRELCLAAGMDDYLSKPFTKAALRAALERWLTPAQQAQAPAPVALNAAAPVVQPATAEAPAETVAEPTIIDPKALQNIRKLQRPGAPDILEKVINLFFTDAPRQILSMREALAAGDTRTLKRSAHTLKSNSANLGAVKLALACKEMEACAGAAQLERAEQSIDAIEVEFARVRDALEAQTAHA
jgi:CheY-like chemotaxis protein/HPt (histidine-containing phosphotransfer) domain-containing protein